MRCWVAVWALALAMALVVVLGGFAAQPARAASEVEITQLRLERVGDDAYLNASVNFALSPLVEDALTKGIALYFVAEAELYRKRWWWTDQLMGQAVRYMRLSYQPLTRRWRLVVSSTPIGNMGLSTLLSQNFDTLDEALEMIKRLGRLRLGNADEFGGDPLLAVVFRFKLDTSQLPRPFQIGVVGHSDWNIAVERSLSLPMENSK